MNRRSDRLPQGWKWVRLGDVCEVILGQSPPSSTYRKIPEGLPFFQGKADFGDISPNPTTWCVEPKKVAEAGDVLISMRAPVGPTNIANARCCIGRGLAAIRCRNEADRDFVLAGLKLYESDISSMGTGSLFNAITGKQLKEFVFPLPPLSEQKRIAALLNQQMAYVEKARKAAEEMLEAAQALPGAFLRQVFPYNLSRDQVGTSNTDNRYFPMVPLGEVAELIRGITFRKSDQLEQATEYSLPIATTKAAQESGIIEDALYHIPRSLLKDERKLLRPGDILISTANSLRLVGRTTHVQDINRPISFGAFMTVIRSNAKILDTYLIHCLRTEFAYDFFSRNATTTTNISNLNFRKLAALRIPLPPLSEQKRIAALLKEQMAYVETVRMSAREQLDAINALPAALLRRAFAGTL